MKRTREMAMKQEQAERALRQSEQFEMLLKMQGYLDSIERDESETISRLERA